MWSAAVLLTVFLHTVVIGALWVLRPFTPAPRHADIASRVSTHREAVTREMNVLARAGIIRQERDALHILDLPRLAEMVHEVLGLEPREIA